MPGVHVWLDGGGGGEAGARLSAVLAPALRRPGWSARIVHASPRLAVGITAYDDYPIATASDDRHLVVLEGRLYAGGTLDDLLALAPRLLDGEPGGGNAAAARWVAGVDGEFVAVLVDRLNDGAVVLTDRYGRLPLHHGADGRRAAVSRDPRVASTLLGRTGLDRLAIAQFLLFGHPLGTSTLFAGVDRLPPATALRLPADHDTLVDLDLEARVAAGRDADPAAAIADALVEACRRRVRRDAAVVLSLSGGIDSRLVAAALLRAGVRPLGVTHVDVAGHEAEEAVAAGRVAETIGMPWRVVPVAPPTGDHVARLLDLKQGANYLGMSRVVPFLDRVAAEYGHAITFFTGDEGDRVLGPVAPPVPLPDAVAVARYLLRKEAILDPTAVAATTGVGVGDLTDDLVARLEAYPERSGALRWAHFMLWERALRWAFEGEDRNRSWFWSVTPFWAPEVFEGAMRLPPAAKALHVLRVGTLRALAPELAGIVDVSTGVQVTSRGFRLRQRARRFGRGAAYLLLGRAGEGKLRRLLAPRTGHAPASPVLAMVRAQLEHPAVGAYLAPDAVARILARAGAVPREQFSVLYTITSLIQALEDGNVPALEPFRSMPFV